MKRFIQCSSLVIFVGILAAAITAPASAQGRDDRNHERDNQRSNRTSTVVCESRDGRRHRCEADTIGRITLSRQLTRNSNCVEGRSWGYDKNVIWVDHGCRAEFLIAGNDGMYRNTITAAVRPNARWSASRTAHSAATAAATHASACS